MGIIRLMHGKLHRVKVTEANVNYVGSITIDEDWMDMVGILPLEEVDVVNLSNGKRWNTYAIPGERGEKGICPNGGAALLCKPGDLLIIYAYEEKERFNVFKNGHIAKVLVLDESNNIQDFLYQELIPNNDRIGFNSISKLHELK